ncbi:hypothetical protein MPF19_08270 [Polaribacter sp. Z014]|uniref:hypothetical protein n=1 Tax=Polaribacter sp. Z014 TaxID=2927126 RepID=UPI00202291BB|nr:hypothetical protein [Polaribacter sp. Z014]MCL7763404.1 hypothetical protein [Polaribacter sp. Z014]
MSFPEIKQRKIVNLEELTICTSAVVVKNNTTFKERIQSLESKGSFVAEQVKEILSHNCKKLTVEQVLLINPSL